MGIVVVTYLLGTVVVTLTIQIDSIQCNSNDYNFVVFAGICLVRIVDSVGVFNLRFWETKALSLLVGSRSGDRGGIKGDETTPRSP